MVLVYSYMRLKNRPRISICIPNYNRSNQLIEVLEDCAHQTIKPYEVIVQDNHSNQKELLTIKKYLKVHNNIALYINRKNIGLARNVNKVINKANGDYVAIVNNDDRLSKYYVEELIKQIGIYPNFKIYTTNAIGFTENGKIIGEYKLSNKTTVIKKVDGLKSLWRNSYFNLITISGATIYRRSYIQNNLFNNKYENEADLDFTLRALSTQDVLYIDKPIYYVRLHDGRESVKIRSNSVKLNAYISQCIIIYSNYSERFKNEPRYLPRIKGLYFLQLFYKYKYSIKNIKILLKITTIFDLLTVILTVPSLLRNHLFQTLMFRIRYSKYTKYFPKLYSVT